MLRCRQCETVTKTVSLDIYRSLENGGSGSGGLAHHFQYIVLILHVDINRLSSNSTLYYFVAAQHLDLPHRTYFRHLKMLAIRLHLSQ